MTQNSVDKWYYIRDNCTVALAVIAIGELPNTHYGEIATLEWHAG
ncbi:MAG: hypothetical protein CFH10_00634 [Alphaproteobacteria bacterium MarineAlpha4_Bin2]|nr:MAG: hypothetical protein CFH10_00634 [Alphaproteobacteria bacterium MarineAlpha4_Bin2]